MLRPWSEHTTKEVFTAAYSAKNKMNTMRIITVASIHQYESICFATYEYIDVSTVQGQRSKLKRRIVSRAPSCNLKEDPLRQAAAKLELQNQLS